MTLEASVKSAQEYKMDSDYSLKYYVEKNWPNLVLIFFLSAKHKFWGLFIWAASNTLTNMWLYLKKIHHHIIIFFFHTYHSISVVIGTFLDRVYKQYIAGMFIL